MARWHKDYGKFNEKKCNRKMALPIDDNHRADKQEYKDYMSKMVKKKNFEIKQQRRLEKYNADKGDQGGAGAEPE